MAAEDYGGDPATGTDTRGAAAAGSSIEPPGDGHHLRVWVGIAAGLAVGSVAYWVDQDRNVADWDEPSLKARFSGEAWRFDDNNLVVNFLLHPISGAGTYNLARTSHFGVPVSAGYSMLSSLLWEWVLEFKEHISVNDIIVTPLGGIPIGEFFYKLGLYLDSAPRPSAATRVAQWTLGTGVQLDRLLDGSVAPPPRDRDSLGLTSAIWHDFTFDYASYLARTPSADELPVHQLGFDGRLVSLPGYLRAGSFGRGFQTADLTQLEVWTELSEHGVGMGLYADTLLFGYHAQHLTGSNTRPHGYAATLGSSLAYRYLDSGAHRFAERLAAVHFPGFGLDWHAMTRHIRLETSARAHADFVGIGALAQADWAAAHPEERGKAILKRQGYFYGWGGSAELSGKLKLGPFRLNGGLFYGKYWSQEGLERHPDRLTVDAPAEASLLVARGSVGVQPPGLPATFALSSRLRRWDSEVDGSRRQARALERGVGLTVGF
jgi:hypothetical protein